MKNFFVIALDYWAAGGLLTLPLLALCFMVWFYFLRTRAMAKILPDLMCKRAMAEVSSARARNADPGRALAIVEEQLDARLSRDFVVLAALTAAAPLLGLLGTVLGMIRTFQAAGTGAEIAGSVAGGISQALITTQFGLVIAIPGVFGLAVLRRYRRQALVRFALCKTGLSRKNEKHI